MAEKVIKGTHEFWNEPKLSENSIFAIHYSTSEEDVDSVQWNVPIDRFPPCKKKSPTFKVLQNMYDLVFSHESWFLTLTLHDCVKVSKTVQKDAKLRQRVIKVTAEIIAEGVVLKRAENLVRNPQVESLLLLQNIFLTNMMKVQCIECHFIVQFQDVSYPPERTWFIGFSRIGAPGKGYASTRHQTLRMSFQNSSDCLETLSADLLALYDDSSHHDVELLCQGQAASAHRNIISARSKVFKEKLDSEDCPNGCLEIKDITFTVLQLLLRYIYTGNLSILTEESARELSEAAEKYAISALKEKCENFLANPVSSQNACNCLQSLSVDLHRLYKEESGQEVKLRCGEEIVPAHKLILSARSHVFKTLLESQDGQTDCVEVKGMDIDVLHQFLRYIYTGILPEMTMELAIELLKAADSYAVTALKARCEDFLVRRLNPQNACDMLLFADTLGGKGFKSSVLSYMVDEGVPYYESIWNVFCDAHPKLAIEVLAYYL